MEEYSYRTHEVLATPVNAKFDPEDVWKDAKLVTSDKEFSNMIRASGLQRSGFNTQLSKLEAGVDNLHEISGLFIFTQWLLTRRIQGPKVRQTLHQLLKWEYSRLKDKSIEEKDQQFSSLAQRLRNLPLLTSSNRKSRSLGDLVPDKYLFRTGGSEQSIKLTRAPARSLDIISPREEIYLLNLNNGLTGEAALKGCSPCKPDPESSLGGSKYCVFPGKEGWEECPWPPSPTPPQPEPDWEYIVQAGNSWWTTFIGVWHGTGYTRTIKRTPSLTVRWIVPELHVEIMFAILDDFHNPFFTCFDPGFWEFSNEHGLSGAETAHNDYEVTVGDTELAFIVNQGIYSRHSAAGRSALYCEGEWSWT